MNAITPFTLLTSLRHYSPYFPLPIDEIKKIRNAEDLYHRIMLQMEGILLENATVAKIQEIVVTLAAEDLASHI